MAGPDASVVLTLVVISATPLHGDAETRWRSEYAKAAEGLRISTRAYRAEGRFSLRFFSGSASVSDRMILAKTSRNRLLVRGETLIREAGRDVRAADSVACFTGEYSFRLKRPYRGKSYLILSYEPRRNGDDLDLGEFTAAADRMTNVLGRPLSERAQSAAFRVKSVETKAEGETEIVRLTFELDDEKFTASGTIDLDPSRRWVIRHSEITTITKPVPSSGAGDAPKAAGPPVREIVDVTYQDLPGGVPFPRKTVRTVRLPKATAYQEERFEIEGVTLGEPPPEVFRLSGYGLPDIPLAPVDRPSLFSWRNSWLWGSFATALVCFLLLRRTRRRSAAVV